MTANHERRDELLKRALFEGRGAEVPAEDEELKMAAGELHAVVRKIETAGQAEIEALLREGEDAELEEAARARLEQLLTQETPRRKGVLRWPGWVAAAAAVVLAFGWFAWDRGAPDPGGLRLGPGELQLLHPAGTVEGYGTFTWRGDLPQGGWFELRIWDAEGDALAEPALRTRVEENEWTPGPDAELPDAIRWEVQAIDVNREPLGGAEAEASLSRR